MKESKKERRKMTEREREERRKWEGEKATLDAVARLHGTMCRFQGAKESKYFCGGFKNKWQGGGREERWQGENTF